MSAFVYGWLPQPYDERDFVLGLPTSVTPPRTFDLRPKMPPVYNQGSLGSCTANAVGAAYQFAVSQNTLAKLLMPSRLFIYYNERVMIDTVNEDSGAYLRDGMKTMKKQGACSETMLPYNINKFTQKPSEECYQAALENKILVYSGVLQTELAIKQAVSSGKPVVFGFMVKKSFQSALVRKTGYYRPKPDEQIVGGHAVVIVGYRGNNFIVRNSWGSDWGVKGYFTMPISEVLNNKVSFDFWAISSAV